MFLMGQHLAYAALSDAPVPPMPARVSAWAIYDQFDSADGERVFLGITSDRHWQRFCEVFDAPDLAADPRLRTNNQRIEARAEVLPKVAALVAGLPLVALTEKAVAAQLPFAHVARPEQLFDDPHLAAGERLLPTELPGGVAARLPALPVELDGRKTVLERSPPESGADTATLLGELGYDAAEIADLAKDGVIVVPDRGETG